ncbi:type II secretion system protein H [Xanthomonas bromi]|uniref:Type II secretion system protein H n=1 Tax=Xanthomonas bromi TaxID=56449 RepID=A0A1C3NH34_9XANT|nr:GspH/FimT family pseudopilin [Xanthomonas bromi]PPV09058.1 type II secretion system protein GspH [Xanthomonas bromi]SBV49712.1 type II secretion system protein H [Xanthomonas bromi]
MWTHIAARRARGFTLLEVLAVLVITALAGMLVVMTLPETRRDLHDHADSLASALMHARDEAMMSLRMVEVSIDAGGYASRRQAQQRWSALDEPPFAAMRWPEGIQAQLPAGSKQLSVRFDPTGAATPQRIALGDGRQQMQVVVDANGVVQVDAPSR